LRTEHLKRHKDLAALFWKYGRPDLARLPGLNGQAILSSDR